MSAVAAQSTAPTLPDAMKITAIETITVAEFAHLFRVLRHTDAGLPGLGTRLHPDLLQRPDVRVRRSAL